MRLRARIVERASLLRALPWGVVVPALPLAMLGVAFIYSASTDFALAESSMAVSAAYHVKQAGYLVAGVALMLALTLCPQRWIANGWPLWLGLGLCMLVAVLVFGKTINGARSWIMLGPFALQPSEFCKPLICVAIAGYFRFHRHIDSAAAFAACIALSLVYFVPIMLQPDFGTSMVFIPMIGAMFWVAGGHRGYMVSLAGIGAAALPSAYLLGVLKPHQVKRIDVYLGSLSGQVVDRTGDGYQILQSLTAIGSGGFSGKGFGEGTQSQLAFLPERHTDFIFAVYAEETGLVGVALFLLVYFVMLERMIAIARNTREPFGRLLVVGVTTMFFSQLFINVGAACGVIPLTGLTLPFMSYGGSSLLASFMSLGLVANIAVQPQRVMGSETF
jgi:rod shape determining protein RodA